MLSATVRDARLNLSKLLKLAQQGHEVVIRNLAVYVGTCMVAKLYFPEQ
mgnify:CR=1 FL=1|jgi:hypothetical protein